MAAGTGFTPSYVMVEDGFTNNVMFGEEHEISQNSDHLNQLDMGKPPRHLSVVRHGISTATLLTPTNPVSLAVRLNRMGRFIFEEKYQPVEKPFQDILGFRDEISAAISAWTVHSLLQSSWTCRSKAVLS